MRKRRERFALSIRGAGKSRGEKRKAMKGNSSSREGGGIGKKGCALPGH